MLFSKDFTLCLVINYASTCTFKGRHFEKKSSLGHRHVSGLKWDNKTYMLKRSILMIVRKNCSLQMLVTSPAAMDGKPTIMVGKQPTAIAAIIVLIISTSALKGNVG